MALARPGVNRVYGTLRCPHCAAELFKTEKAQERLGVYVFGNRIETRYSGTRLTSLEMQIFRLLLILYPLSMSMEQFYQLTTSTSLGVLIYRIRRKIAPLGLYIRNQHGVGYLLEINEPQQGN